MRNSTAITTENVLEYVPLFAGLSTEEIKKIARGTRDYRVNKEEIIFQKGDTCSGLYWVFEGQVKLAVASPDGDEKVIEVLLPGQGFGEELMFTEEPYMVFAQALAASRVLHISKGVILEALRMNHQIAYKILAGVAYQHYQMMTDIEAYTLQTARQRVVNFLLRELQETRLDWISCKDALVSLPIKKRVIASLLNITQEYLSRILRELNDSGLIIMSNNEIHIPDVMNLVNDQGV